VSAEPAFDSLDRDAIPNVVASFEGSGDMAEQIDLASWEPAYTENPHPFCARLREQAPVAGSSSRDSRSGWSRDTTISATDSPILG
jgi:hypothetical protein